MARGMDVVGPPVLDLERISDPSYTIPGTSPKGDVAVHFDPDRCCGAVYHFELGAWSVWGPLAFGQFLVAIRSGRIELGEGEHVRRWVTACGAHDSAAAH